MVYSKGTAAGPLGIWPLYTDGGIYCFFFAIGISGEKCGGERGKDKAPSVDGGIIRFAAALVRIDVLQREHFFVCEFLAVAKILLTPESL